MRFPRWAYATSAALVLGTALVTAWVYPRLPAVMATHWGPGGQADDFMARAWGAWLMPVLMGVLAVLFFGLIPLLEPWRHNLARFRREYAVFGVGLLAFLAGMQGWVLAWNLGWQGDIRRFLALFLAALNGLLAWVLPRARPNCFFGVRTPWTLSSPRVWHETHRLAGRVFALAAAASLVAVLWPLFLWVGVALMVLGSLAVSAYSWWLYRRFAAQV